MPVHFSTLRFPSINLPSFGELRARFTAFKGRVMSALPSIGRRPLEPVRPLQTRSVEQAPAPLQSPIKLLQKAVGDHEAQARLGEEKAYAELKPTLEKNLHQLHQQALNEEITGFDPSDLQPTVTKQVDHLPLAKLEASVDAAQRQLNQIIIEQGINQPQPKLKAVETVETNGLKWAKLEFQLQGPQDNIKLRPSPLAPVKDPAALLGEPSLADLQDGLEKAITPAALKDFAEQLGERIARLNTLDRKSPEARALGKEVDRMADDLGRLIGKVYQSASKAQQDGFAIGLGTQFKTELWNLLRGASSKMPALALDETISSPGKTFVNLVYNKAATQLANHLGGGDKPTLTFNGSAYQQVKVLGKGGGGIAFLYANQQGHQVVVKSKGFGAESEDNLGAQDLADLHNELAVHLASMGTEANGHPHSLGILGVARTPLGQPVAILEFASGGDVENVIGKHGQGGLLAAAVKKGLVSPHAAHLVNLQILQDSISGMAYLQEQRGVRHGDFKPGNLFLQGDGKVKIADLGLARAQLAEPQTDFNGSLDYQPPESFINYANGKTGEITAKADTWAIGIFAHQLFKKEHPFDISGLRGTANTNMAAKLIPYGQGTDGANGVVTTLSENYEKNAAVKGVTSLDRLLNALLHPDPAKRPSLNSTLESSVFDDLGHGPASRSPAVRELLTALSANPQDEALIKAKSAALGI